MKFTKSEALEIIKQNKEVLSEELREKSLAVCRENFGNSVYVRGLIEFTNYCRNNCKYCGIRAGNRNVHRYRLTSYRISLLEKEVEKHIDLVERMTAVEQSTKSAHKRIDELNEEVKQ